MAVRHSSIAFWIMACVRVCVCTRVCVLGRAYMLRVSGRKPNTIAKQSIDVSMLVLYTSPILSHLKVRQLQATSTCNAQHNHTTPFHSPLIPSPRSSLPSLDRTHRPLPEEVLLLLHKGKGFGQHCLLVHMAIPILILCRCCGPSGLLVLAVTYVLSALVFPARAQNHHHFNLNRKQAAKNLVHCTKVSSTCNRQLE